MTDEDETILIPVVSAADAVEPRGATGTRRERRMAARRPGGSWPWLLYALVVAIVIGAAATLAVEGVS